MFARWKNTYSVVLEYKHQLEPLLGRYSSSLLPVVEYQIQNKQFSVHELLKKVQADILSIPETYAEALTNVNTLTDTAFIKSI